MQRLTVLLSSVFGSLTVAAMFWGQYGTDAGGILFVAVVATACVTPVDIISTRLFKRAVAEQHMEEREAGDAMLGQSSIQLTHVSLALSSSKEDVTATSSDKQPSSSPELEGGTATGDAVLAGGTFMPSSSPDAEGRTSTPTGRDPPKGRRSTRWRAAAFLLNGLFLGVCTYLCIAYGLKFDLPPPEVRRSRALRLDKAGLGHRVGLVDCTLSA